MEIESAHRVRKSRSAVEHIWAVGRLHGVQVIGPGLWRLRGFGGPAAFTEERVDVGIEVCPRDEGTREQRT